MMGTMFAESMVEEATLAGLESLGYAILRYPEIAPGEERVEAEPGRALGSPNCLTVSRFCGCYQLRGQ